MAAYKDSATAPRRSNRIKDSTAKKVAGQVARTEVPKKTTRVTKHVAPAQVKKHQDARKKAIVTKVAQVEEDRTSTAATVKRAKDNSDAPKQSRSRRRKQASGSGAPSAPPKRRGRPPKKAIDLDRVTGMSRVTKNTSPRGKDATHKSSSMKPTARIDPRERARIRAQAALTKETTDAKEAKSKKRTTKTLVQPRKRRGITLVEVPDRFIKQIENYLQQLLDNENPEVEAYAPSNELERRSELLVQDNANEDGRGVEGTGEQVLQEEAIRANEKKKSGVLIVDDDTGIIIEDLGLATESETEEQVQAVTEMTFLGSDGHKLTNFYGDEGGDEMRGPFEEASDLVTLLENPNEPDTPPSAQLGGTAAQPLFASTPRAPNGSPPGLNLN